MQTSKTTPNNTAHFAGLLAVFALSLYLLVLLVKAFVAQQMLSGMSTPEEWQSVENTVLFTTPFAALFLTHAVKVNLCHMISRIKTKKAS